MRGNYQRCLSETLTHEGGWSDHNADPGGATMKGVTIATFAKFKGRKVTKAELRAISDADLQAIYLDYWTAVRGDALPAGLDLVAFDAAVNSGPSRGVKWLQQALGVEADGKVGPMTIRAAETNYAPAVIMRAIGFRRSFLKGLKTWPTFGKGWSARLDAVEKAALEMANHEPVRPDVEPAQKVDAPAWTWFAKAWAAIVDQITRKWRL